MGPPEAVRETPHGRTVLVRGDRRHGIWTGRLRRWERRGGQWYGLAVWDQLGMTRSALVHASRLQPLQLPRPVEVELYGVWQPGSLLGWRRQPGYSVWEGEVQLTGHAGADWYRHGLIRTAADTLVWDQAF